MTHQHDSRWASLMVAAQQGDRRSYEQLLREITPVLRRLARQQWPTGSPADFEDIVQETLLTVHTLRHTYDSHRPFQPWLLTLLQRRTVDEIRQRARINRREIALDMFDVIFTADATNHAQEIPADREVLHKAIATLPLGQRQAIALLKQKEMSLKEVSAATGMSIGALKVATHRALKTLRTLLAVTK